MSPHNISLQRTSACGLAAEARPFGLVTRLARACVLMMVVAVLTTGCGNRYASVVLSGNLQRLGFDALALKQLHGCEDPVLKRLLEHDIVLSASAAREFVDRGVKVGSLAAVNLVHSVHAASLYASQNDLSRYSGGDDSGGRNVSENLRVIEAWVNRCAEPARQADSASLRRGKRT